MQSLFKHINFLNSIIHAKYVLRMQNIFSTITIFFNIFAKFINENVIYLCMYNNKKNCQQIENNFIFRVKQHS